MEREEITQVRIGSFQVGLRGLKEILGDLASSMAESSDEQVAEEILSRISKKNFFPEKARSEYSRALVREFRKYLGQEVKLDKEDQGLVIRVLGQGCANCQTLARRIMEVLGELNLPADFEHVTDIKEIARYKVMQSPALLINQKLVAVGRVPSKTQLIEWLKKTD